MATVTFRFLEADTWSGSIIRWRLKEPWSHAAIIIGEYAYNSTFPMVMMVPVTHHSMSLDIHPGIDISLEVTDQELTVIKNWCDSQLCKPYDFLSILGWIVGMPKLQSMNHTYCFEFCRRPLEFLGLLPAPATKELIRGRRLIQEIQTVGQRILA